MHMYAQIDNEGSVIALSHLSEEVDSPNMILLSDSDNEVGLGWRRTDGVWCEPDPVEPEPAVADPLQDIKEMQFLQLEIQLEALEQQNEYNMLALGIMLETVEIILSGGE